jgi:hypothetical protein
MTRINTKDVRVFINGSEVKAMNVEFSMPDDRTDGFSWRGGVHPGAKRAQRLSDRGLHRAAEIARGPSVALFKRLARMRRMLARQRGELDAR